jgi:cytochrome c biogenesis protein CcmG, thiol:disulfide interchange protein DsbE
VRGKLALQIAAVGLVALLLALLGWRLVDRQAGQDIASGALAGHKPAAPNFELPQLTGDGTIALASYRGKVVVLNFWASWCVPCREEAPALQSAWERYRGRGVVVLGVNAQDFAGDARGFVDRYDLTYPNVHDGPGSTLGKFGITGFPETMVVDRTGKIVRYQPGEISADELEQGIQEALQS